MHVPSSPASVPSLGENTIVSSKAHTSVRALGSLTVALATPMTSASPGTPSLVRVALVQVHHHRVEKLHHLSRRYHKSCVLYLKYMQKLRRYK